jgi:protein-L-isoaspartate(D-aspartate) O-methyltransferase
LLLYGLVLLSMGGCAVGDDAHLRDRVSLVASFGPEASARLDRPPVTDERVLQAMLAVPRHEFVPKPWRQNAYADMPLPIGHGQTISQPYIVAMMTDLLDVDADDVVLEIGTGSGYQAAVLAELAQEVYTIEIIDELATGAEKLLAGLNYDNVTVKSGDGYYGWPEHGPFDAIIVTAAPSHVPPPLVEQLKPGGKMVIPVGPVFTVQNLLLIEKQEDGSVKQRSIMPVNFVPFTRTDS